MSDINWPQVLRDAGQESLARRWAACTEMQRKALACQLAEIDLKMIAQLHRSTRDATDWAALAERSQPPPAIRLTDAGHRAPAARDRGAEALRRGEIGVILVAGGQGSRLGFAHPKGMFPLGPVSGHSIFQILFERILATSRRYNAAVPLYVMTSPATHAETVEFLDQHQRFGLAAEDVTVFCQGTMPAVDERTGQLLLQAPDSLALAPDGHGGMLEALRASGALQQAAGRGIRHFSYGQIDNPLVQIGDPELIGHHLLADSEMTSQVVEKNEPTEKVGNVVMVDGQMRIIEYSDLPLAAARQRNDDGSLRIWAGSIAVHVFAVDFLQRMIAQSDALPFHRARKKVPYLDEQGQRVVPDKPNAIKFERFIFDLMPQARRPLVVEGAKQDAFAAVKNGPEMTTETAATSRQAMIALHSRWLAAAGIAVAPGTPVEIGPLWALDGEQVAQRCREHPRTLPETITRPTYLSGDNGYLVAADG